jgi:hypothetical protein
VRNGIALDALIYSCNHRDGFRDFFCAVRRCAIGFG